MKSVIAATIMLAIHGTRERVVTIKNAILSPATT
jgi:hypothetical protein